MKVAPVSADSAASGSSLELLPDLVDPLLKLGRQVAGGGIAERELRGENQLPLRCEAAGDLPGQRHRVPARELSVDLRLRGRQVSQRARRVGRVNLAVRAAEPALERFKRRIHEPVTPRPGRTRRRGAESSRNRLRGRPRRTGTRRA